MDFQISRKRTDNMHDEVISFSGELRNSDLVKLKLNAFEKKLLRDISGDAEATPADHLLVLEMVFRHHMNNLAAKSSPRKLA